MPLQPPIRSLIPLLCVALASPAAAGVNRWTPIGPPGGYVHVITAAPSRPSTLYAGLEAGGIFRSLDHGRTWQPTGRGKIAGLPVYDVAVDPQAPQKVYAATLMGLYRSVDGGATWLGPFLGTHPVYQVEVDPRAAHVLFAGVGGETLFKSTDRGQTWKTAPDWPESVTTIAFDPIRPATVYAGSVGGAWRSHDGGATWKPIDNGLPENLSARRIAVDPRSPEILYLLTSQPRGTVFWSRDRGETWKPRRRGLDGRTPRDIAVDPSNPAVVYLATRQGLLRSTDRGASWKPAGPGLGTALPLELEVTRQRLLIATNTGVFVSTDRGLSLRPSNQNLWATSIGGLAIDSQRPPGLYASDLYAGIFKTRRRGPPWSHLPLEVEQDLVEELPVAVDPRNPSVVYAGIPSRIAKSTDGGEHWTLMPELFCLSPSAIRIDPAEPSTLYVSGALYTSACGLEPEACKTFRSLDGGETWTCVVDYSSPPFSSVLAIDPFTSAIYAFSSGDLYRSTDRGDTWILVHAGLGATFLAASPVTPGTLWALRPGETGRSTDGGQTWELYPAQGLDVAAVSRLVPDPVDPLRLYAVSHDVFRSDDGGRTWAQVGPGLEGLRVTQLVVDPIDPRILYAGTAGRSVMKITQEKRGGTGGAVR